MDELLKEKTLPSGESITLTKDDHKFMVICWSKEDEDGTQEGRWAKDFTNLEDAEKEYDRWN